MQEKGIGKRKCTEPILTTMCVVKKFSMYHYLHAKTHKNTHCYTFLCVKEKVVFSAKASEKIAVSINITKSIKITRRLTSKATSFYNIHIIHTVQFNWGKLHAEFKAELTCKTQINKCNH